MRLHPAKLLPPQHASYYLHGEDRDALFEAADALLHADDDGATCLRVDVSELGLIESESRNQGLFGATACHALVRNAESATPKQTEHLLKLARETRAPNRLIVCAAGIEWKKALHKKFQAEQQVAQCEFSLPDASQFDRWLRQELNASGLRLDEAAEALVVERLTGLRLAARQMIERLRLYDNGAGETIGLDVVGDLLGERSPDDLEAWCHAVAMREPHAVTLTRHLIREQQLSAVQMISWLGTRLQQLLMYLWHQAQGERDPMRAAKVFGEARKKVQQETRAWRGPELSGALAKLVEAEKQVKGASIEDDAMIMERLVLALLHREET
jgi:DNA polymerase III delta subunit